MYKLFVLAGPHCISSCDQFAAIIKDNKIGEIIGMPTKGGHAPYRFDKDFKLVDGIKFSIKMTVGVGHRPNGQPLEAHPAKPSIPFYPNADNRNKYIDKIISQLD